MLTIQQKPRNSRRSAFPFEGFSTKHCLEAKKYWITSTHGIEKSR